MLTNHHLPLPRRRRGDDTSPPNAWRLTVGTEARRCFFFRNDVHHKGVRLLINRTNTRTFDALLTTLSEAVGPSAIRKLYNRSTRQLVSSLVDVVEGGEYVCVGSGEGLRVPLTTAFQFERVPPIKARLQRPQPQPQPLQQQEQQEQQEQPQALLPRRLPPLSLIANRAHQEIVFPPMAHHHPPPVLAEVPWQDSPPLRFHAWGDTGLPGVGGLGAGGGGGSVTNPIASWHGWQDVHGGHGGGRDGGAWGGVNVDSLVAGARSTDNRLHTERVRQDNRLQRRIVARHYRRAHAAHRVLEHHQHTDTVLQHRIVTERERQHSALHAKLLRRQSSTTTSEMFASASATPTTFTSTSGDDVDVVEDAVRADREPPAALASPSAHVKTAAVVALPFVPRSHYTRIERMACQVIQSEYRAHLRHRRLPPATPPKSSPAAARAESPPPTPSETGPNQSRDTARSREMAESHSAFAAPIAQSDTDDGPQGETEGSFSVCAAEMECRLLSPHRHDQAPSAVSGTMLSFATRRSPKRGQELARSPSLEQEDVDEGACALPTDDPVAARVPPAAPPRHMGAYEAMLAQRAILTPDLTVSPSDLLLIRPHGGDDVASDDNHVDALSGPSVLPPRSAPSIHRSTTAAAAAVRDDAARIIQAAWFQLKKAKPRVVRPAPAATESQSVVAPGPGDTSPPNATKLAKLLANDAVRVAAVLGLPAHAHAAVQHARSAPSVLSPRGVVSVAAVEAEYDVGAVLGDGNFAVVRRSVHRATGRECALKIIDKSKLDDAKEALMIENEVAIMRGLAHEHCVRLYDVCDTPGHLYLAMELVPGGDLFDSIAARGGKFLEPDASRVVWHAALGLAYLHAQNIIHRDLKPENLLLTRDARGRDVVKLADFGLSMVLTGPLFTVCGTPTYVAPEIIDESNPGYGLPVDMWALGIIAYILLCGFPPFASRAKVQAELFARILSGQFVFPHSYWKGVSGEAKDLIRRLLVVDPQARFTATQVLEHSWIGRQQVADEHE